MRDSFIAITVLAAIFILGMPAQAAQKIEPYPLEEWAKRATTSNITLSPNGEKLAMLRIMKVGENPILEIYDANDLSVKPFRMDADPMEMQGLNWITDSKILFYARQKVRNKICHLYTKLLAYTCLTSISFKHETCHRRRRKCVVHSNMVEISIRIS
jgi:hypothetical protein